MNPGLPASHWEQLLPNQRQVLTATVDFLQSFGLTVGCKSFQDSFFNTADAKVHVALVCADPVCVEKCTYAHHLDLVFFNFYPNDYRHWGLSEIHSLQHYTTLPHSHIIREFINFHYAPMD